jgi:hypothetical protein
VPVAVWQGSEVLSGDTRPALYSWRVGGKIGGTWAGRKFPVWQSLHTCGSYFWDWVREGVAYSFFVDFHDLQLDARRGSKLGIDEWNNFYWQDHCPSWHWLAGCLTRGRKPVRWPTAISGLRRQRHIRDWAAPQGIMFQACSLHSTRDASAGMASLCERGCAESGLSQPCVAGCRPRCSLG